MKKILVALLAGAFAVSAMAELRTITTREASNPSRLRSAFNANVVETESRVGALETAEPPLMEETDPVAMNAGFITAEDVPAETDPVAMSAGFVADGDSPTFSGITVGAFVAQENIPGWSSVNYNPAPPVPTNGEWGVTPGVMSANWTRSLGIIPAGTYRIELTWRATSSGGGGSGALSLETATPESVSVGFTFSNVSTTNSASADLIVGAPVLAQIEAGGGGGGPTMAYFDEIRVYKDNVLYWSDDCSEFNLSQIGGVTVSTDATEPTEVVNLRTMQEQGYATVEDVLTEADQKYMAISNEITLGELGIKGENKELYYTKWSSTVSTNEEGVWAFSDTSSFNMNEDFDPAPSWSDGVFSWPGYGAPENLSLWLTDLNLVWGGPNDGRPPPPALFYVTYEGSGPVLFLDDNTGTFSVTLSNGVNEVVCSDTNQASYSFKAVVDYAYMASSGSISRLEVSYMAETVEDSAEWVPLAPTVAEGFSIANETQLVFVANGVTNIIDADITTQE